MTKQLRLQSLISRYAGLRITCDECQHEGVIPVPWLVEQMGSQCLLDNVRRKLRCRKCSCRSITLRPDYRMERLQTRLYAVDGLGGMIEVADRTT